MEGVNFTAILKLQCRLKRPLLYTQSEHEGQAVRAVFIDDDIRELVKPSLAELPGLLRVLLRRKGL